MEAGWDIPGILYAKGYPAFDSSSFCTLSVPRRSARSRWNVVLRDEPHSCSISRLNCETPGPRFYWLRRLSPNPPILKRCGGRHSTDADNFRMARNSGAIAGAKIFVRGLSSGKVKDLVTVATAAQPDAAASTISPRPTVFVR
jgi:hypothetical protein